MGRDGEGGVRTLRGASVWVKAYPCMQERFALCVQEDWVCSLAATGLAAALWSGLVDAMRVFDRCG